MRGDTRATRRFLAVGILLMVSYYLIPDKRVQEILYDVIGVISLVAIVVMKKKLPEPILILIAAAVGITLRGLPS